MRNPIMKLCLLFIAAVSAFAQAPHSNQFHITRTIELGGEGSWDYLRYDLDGRRLFISRSTHVMVADLAEGKLIGDIPGTDGVHGIAIVPSLGRGVTSNGKANNAFIFDQHSLKVLATVATGVKPDGILYEPFTKAVLTMNAGDNSISMIDVAAAKVIATIALPGRPETAISDGKGNLFVNLEDKSQIAAISLVTHKVVQTWDLAGCTEPTGLAIDAANARLLTACHNSVFIVVDAGSGKNIQKLPIGLGVDAVAYDSELKTVFTTNKDGTLSVIRRIDADHYENQETVQTLPGAKTIALDPERHLVYTVANQNGKFVLLEIGR